MPKKSKVERGITSVRFSEEDRARLEAVMKKIPTWSFSDAVRECAKIGAAVVQRDPARALTGKAAG